MNGLEALLTACNTRKSSQKEFRQYTSLSSKESGLLTHKLSQLKRQHACQVIKEKGELN